MKTLRVRSYTWHLYAGAGVIERHLAEAAARAGARRVFVVCSPSVNGRGDTITRIAAALGERFAGVFDGIEKDSTYRSVSAAAAAARDAGADLLIAAGGGSVIVATRAVAIFLGEPGDPFELMTQYPPGQPAFSPRLQAAKLPIVNIPTTPTSAMNRAGTGLGNPDLDHRMEYFDPKTRPRALFLDAAVLASTPPDVWRSTATTVFAGVVGARAQTDLNPLAAGDCAQAFDLAYGAYRALAANRDGEPERRDMALAALLQNRAEDDGRARFGAGPFAGDYAVSTALHLSFPRVGQGESTSVVHAAVLRRSHDVDDAAAARVAHALDVWRDGMTTSAAVTAIADRLDALYRQVGMPVRLRELQIPEEALADVAAATVKNFNANAGARAADTQVRDALELLHAAW